MTTKLSSETAPQKTLLEQAARQALEALENYGVEGTKSVAGIKCTEAITALREALDHSGEATEMVQKPIGVIMGGELVGLVDEYKTGAWPIYAALVAANERERIAKHFEPRWPVDGICGTLTTNSVIDAIRNMK